MDARQTFRVGAKLIASYYLILALPTLLGFVLQILPMVQGGGGRFDTLGLRSSFAVDLLFSVMLVIVGLYILRDGALFLRWTHSADDFDNTDSMVQCFAVGVKLLSVYFVLSSIPALSQRLANFLLLFYARDGGFITEGLGMPTNFLPQIVVILFGLLLLTRGDLLTRWAFLSKEHLDIH